MPNGSIRFDLEDKTAKAEERERREESPLPDQKKAMWACVACGIMNTVHHLHCQVSRCGQGQPLLQQIDLRESDWFCPECNTQSATTTIRGGAPCAIGLLFTLVTGSANGRDVET
jgi:hypothetical protein